MSDLVGTHLGRPDSIEILLLSLCSSLSLRRVRSRVPGSAQRIPSSSTSEPPATKTSVVQLISVWIQTSSRKSASLWLCYVHNLINLRLGKEEFDCLTLDATYDCGCGDEAGSGEVATQRGLDGVSKLNDSSVVGDLHKDRLESELHRDERDTSTGDRGASLYRRLSRRR